MKVLNYSTKLGKEPIEDWLCSLKDKKTSIRIKDRINRICEFNYLGEYKRIDEELYELKFHFGAGYRVYFIFLNEETILLINGGDKSSQVKDIKKAKQYLEELQND